MGCGSCGKAKAARAARPEGSSSGQWELIPLDGPPEYFDNRLAAMAADALAGGGGVIRKLSNP
jgi:hypothetical protein